MLKVVHSFVDSKRMICFCMACAMLSVALISFGAHATNPTNVDYNVYVNPSLNISVSSNNVVLNINPAGSLNGANNPNNFATNNLTVGVGTNNQYGYRLYVDSSTTNLTKTDDSTQQIPTLTTATSETDFPYNKWGYKLSTESNYKPFQSNDLISQSNIATNVISETLTFAAKANYDKPAGTYELNLNFKALPQVTTTHIQNLDPDLCTEDPTVVIDSRDQQPYTIQKLKDGNCWMMTNLNLQHITNNLTADDTNIAENTTLSKDTFNGWKKTSGTGNYTSGEFIPVEGIDSISNTPYGTLYNYCAISAGTYCYSSGHGVGDSGQDLCPAGWRLPTDNEFSNLLNNSAYNTYAKMRASIFNGGAGFALGGASYLDPPEPGSVAKYWASTWNDVGGMKALRFDETTVMMNQNSRGTSYNIRCVRDSRTIDGISNMQDITSIRVKNTADGTTATLKDTRDNRNYTVAKINGNLWMAQNLLFTGYTLNAADSNVSTTRTLYGGGAWNRSNGYSLKDNASSSSTHCYGNSSDKTGDGFVNSCMYYIASDSNIGNKANAWYNYAAATAGTINYAGSSTDATKATESICPKDWTLPSRAQIDSIVGTSYISLFVPVKGGHYQNGGFYGVGSGFWWTNTSSSNAIMRYTMQYDGSALQYNGAYRFTGLYIRCVAR